ncbi:MAG: hypothetical protein L3J15_06945 [Devosiaceae bacterium]|nr:hypothetical protein [Devosiaceae bacterium]
MNDENKLSPLQQRVDEPARFIGLEELAATWFSQTIEIKIFGYGELLNNKDLLPFIRRAWGSELVRGASSEAINEAPCPWTPPCALDVFFREQMRYGKHGIPKPYVFAADKKEQNLVVKLNIFGFANDWLPVAVELLVQTLRERVSWGKLARGEFLPKFEITQLRTSTIEGFDVVDTPDMVEISFITPLDSAGNSDLIDEPHSFIGRLARRIDGLARWQDAKLEADWFALSEQWKGLKYWSEELTSDYTKRWSHRQNANLVNDAVSGKLMIAGNLAPILPLLIIGQNCHAGRGAVTGQGRYNIILSN